MSNEAKSDMTNATTTRSTESAKQPVVDTQTVIDKETEQGFRGTEVDNTPNENYTVAGVTSKMPTPETNVDAARSAREDTGLGLSGLESATREKAAEKKRSNK